MKIMELVKLHASWCDKDLQMGSKSHFTIDEADAAIDFENAQARRKSIAENKDFYWKLRLPTEEELERDFKSLDLRFNGYRSKFDGTKNRKLYIDSSEAYFYPGYRDIGFSVRCIIVEKRKVYDDAE